MASAIMCQRSSTRVGGAFRCDGKPSETVFAADDGVEADCSNSWACEKTSEEGMLRSLKKRHMAIDSLRPDFTWS